MYTLCRCFHAQFVSKGKTKKAVLDCACSNNNSALLPRALKILLQEFFLESRVPRTVPVCTAVRYHMQQLTADSGFDLGSAGHAHIEYPRTFIIW